MNDMVLSFFPGVKLFVGMRKKVYHASLLYVSGDAHSDCLDGIEWDGYGCVLFTAEGLDS